MRTVIFTLIAILMVSGLQAQDLVISEINYNSAPDHDSEDWIEIYNNTPWIIELSGYTFKDANDDNIFVFPDLFLESNSFIVLCRDTVDFSDQYPDVEDYVGNMEFNLSNGGELVRLYDDSGALLDSLTYDDEPPWPEAPDGGGYTLELMSPDLPNHLYSNWMASTVLWGTPGEEHWMGITHEPNPAVFPESVRLLPAYPNPFNPSTTLSFELPSASQALLSIYDVQGNKVKTLVDSWLKSGVYYVDFDATNLATGTYFARLEIAGALHTQKLTLLK